MAGTKQFLNKIAVHNFVIGDFNSHHTSWGYGETDENGHNVELWTETNKLVLVHDQKLPKSFNSGRWKRGYNSDIIFVSDIVESQCTKEIGNPVPHTQHHPIVFKITAAVKPRDIQFKRRYSFKNANWNGFSKDLNNMINIIKPIPENYDALNDLVKSISRKNIPRGCQTRYIPVLTPELMETLNKYMEMFETNPFEEETIKEGDKLLKLLSDEKRKKW